MSESSPPPSSNVLAYAETIPTHRLVMNMQAENCFVLGALYPIVAMMLFGVSVAIGSVMASLVGSVGAILAILVSMGLSLVVPFLGLRLGIRALREMRQCPARNHHRAIVGLALHGLYGTLVLALAVFIVLVGMSGA